MKSKHTTPHIMEHDIRTLESWVHSLEEFVAADDDDGYGGMDEVDRISLLTQHRHLHAAMVALKVRLNRQAQKSPH